MGFIETSFFKTTSFFETTFRTLSYYGRYAAANWLPRRRTRRVSSPEKRHLVILAWFFAPDINGGVYRPAALARNARDNGYRVTVFASPAPLTWGRAWK
jgi:hypothetical protein